VEALPKAQLPLVFELTPLPEKYNELLVKFFEQKKLSSSTSSSSSSSSSSAKEEDKDPVLCLICGELLHINLINNTGEMGTCTQHSYTCGGGVGMFLLLNDGNVASVVNGFAFLMPTPYLNQFGEIRSVSRSNILSLDRQRYNHLRELLLDHKLFSKLPLFNISQDDI